MEYRNRHTKEVSTVKRIESNPSDADVYILSDGTPCDAGFFHEHWEIADSNQEKVVTGVSKQTGLDGCIIDAGDLLRDIDMMIENIERWRFGSGLDGNHPSMLAFGHQIHGLNSAKQALVRLCQGQSGMGKASEDRFDMRFDRDSIRESFDAFLSRLESINVPVGTKHVMVEVEILAMDGDPHSEYSNIIETIDASGITLD